MSGQLWVIGIGPGSEASLTTEAQERMALVSRVFAFSRYLPLTQGRGEVFGPSLDLGMQQLTKALAQGDVGLLVTGDPTEFSLLSRLKEEFPTTVITVVPAHGARTALFAALGTAQDSPCVLTGHGRSLSEDFYVGKVMTNTQTLLFCDRLRSPKWAAQALIDRGLDLDMAVGVNLSYDDEQIVWGKASFIAQKEFSGHSLALVINPSPRQRFWGGLPDQSFERGSLPMTKSAVRAAVVSALAPQEDHVIWDIGSGTGSVSVELGLAAPCGTVWALERESEGESLLEQNCQKHGAYNVHFRHGEAPSALMDLPRPDRVFIGGSGGELEEILAHIATLGEGIRVAISSVTLETAATCGVCLKKLGYTHLSARTIQVTDWRLLQNVSLAQAQNPVTLWVGETGGTK